MRMQLYRFVLIAICVSVGQSRVSAQPLADRVPGDAVAYIGWCGSDGIPASYDSTHLKAIIDNSKIDELFTNFLPRLGDLLAASTPQARQPVQVIKTVGALLWKHPTAIFFAGMDMSDPANPMPRIGLICKAGADGTLIQRQLSPLIAQMQNKVGMTQVQDTLIITVGYRDPATVLQAAGALKGVPAFTTAMKQVQADPMLIAYIDYEKGLSQLQAGLAGGEPQAAAMFPKILGALGVSNLKRAVMTAGFDGKDWMSQCFVEIPSPRSGLFESLNNQPISPDLLKTIPSDADFVSVGRFDPAKLITTIRDTSGQVSPQAQQMVDQVLGGVQVAIARNLVTDILEPLGSDWGIYASPSVAGNGLLGLVMVNHLDDPAKASMSLSIAWTNLSNWANVALKRGGVNVQITGQMIEIDGVKVYYAGTPVFAPAWTVKDGNLYMGLYPQSVAAAASATTRSGGKSIVDSEKFVAMQKRVGVTNPIGFTFMDLPTDVLYGSMYQKLLLVGRYAGFADMFGVPLPEPLLPPLNVIQREITPSGSFGWVDDAGYHVKSISAFPGSDIFSEPALMAGGAGGAALATSILLPSLNRARETANRVKCAAQLKGMGNAIMLYSNDNKGNYPPDMMSLVQYMENMGFQRGTSLICPSSNTQAPVNLAQMSPEQYAAWANDNGSYIYVGGGKTARTANADTILIYERPEDHNKDGMNMLFGDGHVDWLRMPQALQMIQKQQGK